MASTFHHNGGSQDSSGCMQVVCRGPWVSVWTFAWGLVVLVGGVEGLFGALFIPVLWMGCRAVQQGCRCHCCGLRFRNTCVGGQRGSQTSLWQGPGSEALLIEGRAFPHAAVSCSGSL